MAQKFCATEIPQNFFRYFTPNYLYLVWESVMFQKPKCPVRLKTHPIDFYRTSGTFFFRLPYTGALAISLRNVQEGTGAGARLKNRLQNCAYGRLK